MKHSKKLLLSNPREALKQHGVELPAEVNVRFIENTATQLNFVLPAKPEELSDEQLGKISGGGRSGFMSPVNDPLYGF